MVTPHNILKSWGEGKSALLCQRTKSLIIKCYISWNVSSPSPFLPAPFTDQVFGGRRLSTGCLLRRLLREKLPCKRDGDKDSQASDTFSTWNNNLVVESYLLIVKSRISAVWPWYSDTMLPERASHRRSAPSKLQVDTTEEDSSHCRWTMPAWRNTERNRLINKHWQPAWTSFSSWETTAVIMLL